jgi:hypothetical protein
MALAALFRLRSVPATSVLATQVIDFSGLEAIASIREMALAFNADVDAALEAAR